LWVECDVIGGFGDHRVFYLELSSCARFGRAFGSWKPEVMIWG
jgi:hypothetical protein